MGIAHTDLHMQQMVTGALRAARDHDCLVSVTVETIPEVPEDQQRLPFSEVIEEAKKDRHLAVVG